MRGHLNSNNTSLADRLRSSRRLLSIAAALACAILGAGCGGEVRGPPGSDAHATDAGGEGGASDATTTSDSNDSPDASLADAATDGTLSDAPVNGAAANSDAACNTGQFRCMSGCTDTNTDPSNCGACGDPCPVIANAQSTCTHGTCGYTCDPDAGLTDCDGGCYELASDPSNCGSCGNACPAGPSPGCGNGSCNYTLEPSADQAWFVTTDGKSAYWSTFADPQGAIHACPLTGCGGNPTVLAANQGQPGPVATDGVNVYWGQQGGGPAVMSCAVTGCAGNPTTVVTTVNYVVGIATDGTNVYWTDENVIQACPVTGCTTPTLLATAPSVNITTDGTNVYWTSYPEPYSPSPPAITVLACAVNGCPGGPTTLATGQKNPSGIATDGVNVYWIDFSSGTGASTVMSCPVGGCPNGPTTLASGQYGENIATDGINVYWDTPYTVVTCSVNGCGSTPKILASVPDVDLVATTATMGSVVFLANSVVYFAAK